MDKIEKLPEDEGFWPLYRDKINELIESHNKLQNEFVNHFHHARELQFGTDEPKSAATSGKNKVYE